MEVIFENEFLKVTYDDNNSKNFWISFGSLELGDEFGLKYIKERNEGGIYFIPKDAHWYQIEDIFQAIAITKSKIPNGARVITYGSSMGGFAAIAFAKDLNANCVIAAAPQVSIDPNIVGFDKRWEEIGAKTNFMRSDAREGVYGDLNIIYDSMHYLDKKNAEMILDNYPGKRYLFPFAGHGVLHTLRRINELKQIINGIVDNKASYIQIAFAKYKEKIRKSADYYATIAELLYDKHKYEKSSLFYSRALLLNPTMHVYYQGLSDVLWKLRFFDAAIEADRKSVELLPECGGHHIRLGLRLVDTKRLEEAFAIFTKAIEIMPNFGAAYNGVSIVYQKKGDLENAITYLKKATELDIHNIHWQNDLRELVKKYDAQK